MKKNSENIKLLEVMPNDRYILVASVPKDTETDMVHNIISQARDVQTELDNWWKSNAKFFLLVLANGVEVELKRMEDD